MQGFIDSKEEIAKEKNLYSGVLFI